MASAYSNDRRGILVKDDEFPPEIDACVGLYDLEVKTSSFFCGRSTFGSSRKYTYRKNTPGVGSYDLPRPLGAIDGLRPETKSVSKTERFQASTVAEGDPGKYNAGLPIGKPCPITRPEAVLTTAQSFSKEKRQLFSQVDQNDFVLGPNCQGTVSHELLQTTRRHGCRLLQPTALPKKNANRRRRSQETSHTGLRLLLRQKFISKESTSKKPFHTSENKHISGTAPRLALLEAMAQAGRAHCAIGPGPCAYADDSHSLAQKTSRTHNIRLLQNAVRRRQSTTSTKKSKRSTSSNKSNLLFVDDSDHHSNLKHDDHRNLFIMQPPPLPSSSSVLLSPLSKEK